ncbi:hypothetical protein [Cellulomonas shaoxiangyii]|uniref:DUF559 domain-containing protein n=1 Tax=Cellulomonas shaoxiangyii TaxID=2566013 RepID=A0A4P7SLP1_9CELL|nr:hypothetical protein [Cellulomonas shaoxiangyii]QCB94658.1 hypothetical protein E5225_14930 [Cellulomonas shaoxiangyii]TGY84711.1 hypothetical protein E5226_09925 [Cellulomonas shaoxiangyii]
MRRPQLLPRDLLRLAAAQAGLLSSRQCDDAGVTDARRAALRRAGVLAPVVTGVHEVAAEAVGGPADPAGRRVRTAWLALLTVGVDHAVATGCCALALLGVEGLPAGVAPEVASRRGATHAARGGVRMRRLGEGTRVLRLGGALVVDPVSALAQAVPELSRPHAVAVLDSALQRRLVRPADLALVQRATRGRRGAARTATWWALVDGRAQSPLESWARLQCQDAGVPPHDLQVPVRDAGGRVLARGDLGWWLRDGRLLVAEIDGAGPHGTPAALFHDRARQNAIVATGAVVLRFTARDVHAGTVARTVRRHPLRPPGG